MYLLNLDINILRGYERKMKKKSNNKKELTPDSIKDNILGFFSQYSTKPYSIKQLLKKFGLRNEKERNLFTQVLKTLAASGTIKELKNSTYRYNGTATFVTGRVDFVNPRFAYVCSDEVEEDIWVSSNKLLNAFDGDIVKVLVTGKVGKAGEKGKSGKPEGEVVEILERKRDEYVGKIDLAPRFAFVIPDNRKMHYDIFIPQESILDAKNGDKVIVKITEWPDKNNKNPVGKVIEVLGAAGNNDVEMHSIMAEYGLPMQFSPKVIEESEEISSEIPHSEIRNRKDFRNTTTFTIDPVDAKDFDDALSIKKLENGNWEIGIHIADVTHYVKLSSTLEKEAFKRATSVYLVDRVVPMLPEKLSNGLCSLRPNEDKLTFSAVFEMDENAHILHQWFGKTIIHSDKRFAYEDVQKIIEEKKGEYFEEIQVLNGLAHKLRKERFKKGAIGFETIEVKFRLDENGVPLEVVPKIRKDAHKLIEDFMLLANRKVAEYVYFMKKGEEKNTFVYRIHDHPNPDKINALAIFAKKFGHNILVGDEAEVAAALNKLVEDVEGKPEQNVLQSLAIRTMAKAKYSTEPEIHFGLAYKHYTHFTSPIRRYPDMMVHRLLEHYLNGGKSENKTYYEDKCEHSSEMEKLAADAERASIKYKQVQYMQKMMDQEFDGIVSGVIEYGFFVEIVETKCEGMVRLSDLEDDFYEFDAENYRIFGKRNKKMITLGDKVRVRVKKTDLEKRTIDLTLLQEEPTKKNKYAKL
jgi:ribonuclease R